MLLHLFLIFFTFVSYVLFFDKSKKFVQSAQNEMINFYCDVEAVFQSIKEIRADLLDIKKLYRKSLEKKSDVIHEPMNSNCSTPVVIDTQ